MLPTLQELLGPADAQAELGRVARLVGLQFHEETARDMLLPPISLVEPARPGGRGGKDCCQHSPAVSAKALGI